MDTAGVAFTEKIKLMENGFTPKNFTDHDYSFWYWLHEETCRKLLEQRILSVSSNDSAARTNYSVAAAVIAEKFAVTYGRKKRRLIPIPRRLLISSVTHRWNCAAQALATHNTSCGQLSKHLRRNGYTKINESQETSEKWKAEFSRTNRKYSFSE